VVICFHTILMFLKSKLSRKILIFVLFTKNIQFFYVWKQSLATFKWPFVTCGEWRMGWTTLIQNVEPLKRKQNDGTFLQYLSLKKFSQKKLMSLKLFAHKQLTSSPTNKSSSGMCVWEKVRKCVCVCVWVCVRKCVCRMGFLGKSS